ncbi:MAG: AAA family ATPase [Eubacteriales bacterium]
MSTWLIPIEEMTPDQLRAIELMPQEHRVIFGPPGSGKTQILLHRAKYLSETWKVPPGRFHIFVFTKVLKDYIKSALDFLDLPDECVSNLDKWCYDFHIKHIGKVPRVVDGKNKIPDFSGIRRAILKKMRTNSPGSFMYDFVLVDEGQDLDGESFDLIKAIAKHVTVCLDNKQQIYEQGSSEAEILKRLGLRRRNIYLLEAYRCCPHIISLAAQFISNPEDRQSFVRQARTYSTEKMTPLLYYASDFEDEKRRLIEVLKGSLLRGEKTAVLFPQKRYVFGYANGFREVDLQVETPDNLDFTSELPKLLPYPSAKGLTFDTVLIPRLDLRSFVKVNEDRIDRLLFVGITRATKWVYMSAQQGKEIKALSKLKALQDDGSLTIQYSSAVIPSSNDIDHEEETEDILNLL